MEGPSNDQNIKFRVENCPDYVCNLRLSERARGSAKMTVLLFIIDFCKERSGISKMENPETALYFDAENPTTPEEILKTKMEEALIKRQGTQNPFNDHLESALAD